MQDDLQFEGNTESKKQWLKQTISDILSKISDVSDLNPQNLESNNEDN